jgi:hypothetical protein
MKLSNPFKRSKPEPAEEVAVEAEPEVQSHGRVVRSKTLDYKPFRGSLRGGRVVKTMPRELRKIKEAQEMIPDDKV